MVSGVEKKQKGDDRWAASSTMDGWMAGWMAGCQSNPIQSIPFHSFPLLSSPFLSFPFHSFIRPLLVRSPTPFRSDPSSHASVDFSSSALPLPSDFNISISVVLQSGAGANFSIVTQSTDNLLTAGRVLHFFFNDGGSPEIGSLEIVFQGREGRKIGKGGGSDAPRFEGWEFWKKDKKKKTRRRVWK